MCNLCRKQHDPHVYGGLRAKFLDDLQYPCNSLRMEKTE